VATREAAVALVVALPFVIGLSAAADDAPRPLLRFADPAIVESSGLVARDGLLWTVNDSGDEARVYTVDRSGRTVGVSRWDADPVDVEALAPGPPGRVWVGDIGDNAAARGTVSVSSVAVGRGQVAGEARTFDLAYPGGSADAEALLADPRSGRLVVVTKGLVGGQVLVAPRELDPDRVNRLQPLGGTLPLVTDGAFLPDGRHVVLRDYTRAVVYTYPGLAEVGEVPLPRQQQGEGIAVADDGRLVVSSEGLHAPVHAVDLPARVARAVGGRAPDGESSAPATPEPRPEPTPESGPEPAQDPAPDPGPVRREPWPWLVGVGVLGVMVVVLLRSLRPR
jgi:hypothetical protein